MKPHLLWLNWPAGCAGRGAGKGKLCSLQQDVFNSQQTLPRYCHGSQAWSETCVSECKLGTTQWHPDLCLGKQEILNGDFFLEAWLLQVEHLWKLWSHEVHPQLPDNRSSETSLNSNKSKGILPICSHALFFPCGKHMVAFKLGTFLSQLCHRFQEWLCISHLAFVQFAGCRKSQATAFFSFCSREIQYSDEHNNLCIKQMCKRQDHNLYIQTLFH